MLKVIGPGMGRTGTDSLRNALDILGVGPCHHMTVVRETADLIEPWTAIMNGETADWDSIFTGFGAQADWPGAFYWRELASHFPEAKIVLSVRSAESWYKSMTETILPFVAMKGRHLPPHRNDIAEWVGWMLDKEFAGRVADPEHAMAVYEAHNEAVQDEIDPDRLLVFPVGSGWEPLCAHLGLDVPDTPFPSGNSTADFRARVAANLRDY